jgi:Holliday junction resolvase RusA-like endonuclease
MEAKIKSSDSDAPIRLSLEVKPKTIQSGLRFGRGRVFRDKRSKGYMDLLGVLAKSNRPAKAWDGPIRVDVSFVFERPKSLKGFERELAPVRPDRDNLLKPLMDALTIAGFWRDDGQVCAGETSKFYAAKGESPKIEVLISRLTPPRITRC